MTEPHMSGVPRYEARIGSQSDEQASGAPTPRVGPKNRSFGRTRDADRTTCRCGRQWTGSSACHCAGCRQFSSIEPFDRHHIGGRCNDPATLTRKDGSTPTMVSHESKFGPVWSMLRDDRPPWRGPEGAR